MERKRLFSILWPLIIMSAKIRPDTPPCGRGSVDSVEVAGGWNGLRTGVQEKVAERGRGFAPSLMAMAKDKRVEEAWKRGQSPKTSGDGPRWMDSSEDALEGNEADQGNAVEGLPNVLSAVLSDDDSYVSVTTHPRFPVTSSFKMYLRECVDARTGTGPRWI